MSRSHARDLFHGHYDPSDPWGSIMGVRFDICATLDRLGLCPPEWEYRPGAGPDTRPDTEWDLALADGSVTTDDMIGLGHTLARWCERLREAGRDY